MASKGRKSVFWLTPVLLVIVALIFYFAMHISKEEKGQPNVILITMDSLRHDHLGCSGYERAHTPSIDAVAQDGVLFREAFAQGSFTRISVPTIITGMFPLFTGIRTFRGHLDSVHTTLAEVLSADGYATLATNRMWSASFYQGFDETGGSDKQTPWRTQRAIQGVEDLGHDKFFIWLYYWDPHAPYQPPEEFMQLYEPNYVRETPQERVAKSKLGSLRDASDHYNGSIGTLKKLNAKEIRLTSLDRRHLIDLYNAEIAYVDQGIGELIAKLKQMNLYDNTLIVINSDHGEGFGEHGHWYHGSTVYDEMIRVPIIIKPPHPQEKNRIVWDQVRNIDIMPTILDYCGLEPPQACNGQSLRPFIEGTSAPQLPVITETQVGKQEHLVALRQGGYKLIYDVQNAKAWLYDLNEDPGERESLLPDSTIVEPSTEETSSPWRQMELQMRQDLLGLLNLTGLSGLSLSAEDLGPIDEKTKERLKALGYVY